jgi:aldehyde dehydrogenase (NAD+)
MSTIAQQFGMTEALEKLGVKAINEGTSTGNNWFSNGEVFELFASRWPINRKSKSINCCRL